MARLSLVVDPSGAERGFQRAGSAAEQAKGRMRGVPDVAQRIDGSFRRLTDTVFSLQGAFAAIGGGVALQQIIRRFSDFERQLTEVGKTTDIEGQRLDQLGRRIQDVAQRIPLATSRLLDLATAAGQLGVTGVDNITKFTETLGKLETATDLAGQEGARSLARLLNITGQAVSDIDRLGASITALGNQFATTEQEIAQTSTFLASSTQQFDLSAQQVLGLSAALRSLGQRAETSGSAVGAALNEINTAITAGGERLQTLVNLTGQSAQQLRQEFGENAVSVLTDFSEALGNIPAAQQTEVLDQFNLAGRETRRVIGALASDTQMVRDALQTANSEWERNQALNREAARAAETFSGQMQIVSNALDEAAVIAGRELAPVILDLATDFRDFLQQTSDSGQLEAFFRNAATQADAFLEKLTEVFRGIAAISLALKGGSLGARLGGLPGFAVGATAGGATGFFSPELLSELADRIADVRQEAGEFGTVINRAMANASGGTREAIGQISELNTALNEAFKGVNSQDGGLDVDLSGVNSALQEVAQTQTRVGEVVRDALSAVDGSIDSYKEFRQVQADLSDGALRLAQSQDEVAGSTGNLNDETTELSSVLQDAIKPLNEIAGVTVDAGDGADEAASAFQRVTESLRQEIELVGATREERKLSNALRRAEVDLATEQGQAIQGLVEEYFNQVRAQEEANRVLEDATTGFLETQRLAEQNTDTINETSDATRDLGIQTQSTADIMRGAFEEVGRSIQSGIRDALLGAERDLVETAKRIAADIAAAFATQRIIIPAFVQPVAGALGLAGSAGSAAAGQGGIGADGFSTTGSLLSSGSSLLNGDFSNLAAGSLGTTLFGQSASTAATNTAIQAGTGQFGLSASQIASQPTQGLIGSGGGTFADALNAGSSLAGIGGGLVGGLAGQAVFEGGNPYARAGLSTGGSIGGAALGTAVLPGIGTAIGAALGSFAGQGLGSLFGGESPPSRFINRRFQGREGRLVQTAAGSDEATDEQEKAFDQLSQFLRQGVNQTVGSFGASLESTAPIAILQSRRKGTRLSVDRDLDRDFEDSEMQRVGSVSEALTGAVREIFERGQFSGLGQREREQIDTVLANSNATDPQQLISDLQFGSRILDFGATSQLSETEQAIENVRDRFGELIDRANRLGLETDVLVQRRNEEIEALERQQRAQERQAASQRLQEVFSTFQSVIQREREPLAESASRLRSIVSALESGLENFRLDTAETNRTRQTGGQARLSGLLADARNGNLPDPDVIQDVVNQLGSPDTATFGNRVDFMRSTLGTQAELRELQDISDDQLSETEQQISLLEQQLEEQKKAVDAALGNQAASLSIAEAMRNLNIAIDERTRLSQDFGDRETLNRRLSDRFDFSGDFGGGAFWRFARRQGVADDAAEYLERQGRGNLAPAEFRAMGGSVSAGDPYVVGERGPELFVPKSDGAVLPNGMMGELRALRKEVAELREVTRGGFNVNNKATIDMEKRQKRWYRDEQEAGNI